MLRFPFILLILLSTSAESSIGYNAGGPNFYSTPLEACEYWHSNILIPDTRAVTTVNLSNSVTCQAIYNLDGVSVLALTGVTSQTLTCSEIDPSMIDDGSGNCVIPQTNCTQGEQLQPQYTPYPIQQAQFVHGDCEVKVTSCGATQEVIVDGYSTQFAKCNFELTGNSKSESNFENLPEPDCFGSCTELPDNTCNANQSGGTFNGQFVCVDNQSGEFADTEPPETKSKSSSKDTIDNGDGTSTTTTTTTTTNNYGDTTTTVSSTTTNNTTGETVSESSTTTGDGAATGDQEGECDPMVSDCGGSSEYTSRDKTGLYEKTQKTFDTVIEGFQSRVSASALFSAVDGFFDVSLGGSCPIWTLPPTDFTPSIPIDMQCSTAMTQVWPFIAAVLILVMGFTAWRIAIDD